VCSVFIEVFFRFVFFLGISTSSVDSTMNDVGTQTEFATRDDVVFLILQYIERLLYIIAHLPASDI